jgi:hypothetical protein
MPEDLGLVAGGDLLELGPAFHLLKLPEDGARIGLLQQGQPDLFDLAVGIAQRMSRRLHGRHHFWIRWSEEARGGEPADTNLTGRFRAHPCIDAEWAD